jgi:hypothetical protein
MHSLWSFEMWLGRVDQCASLTHLNIRSSRREESLFLQHVETGVVRAKGKRDANSNLRRKHQKVETFDHSWFGVHDLVASG